jgi:hypothetical protein
VRRAASIAVAAVLLGGPGVAAAVDTPAGSLGLRLLDQPSRYLVATVAPGEQLRHRVEISNTTTQPLEVQLYAAAASADGPGGFDFAPDRTPNELSGWTAVRPSSVQVDAGDRAVAEVEIVVPESAAPGERLAVVWAEQAGSSGAGLTLVSRVGVRMYVEVAPADRDDELAPAVVIAGGLVLIAAGVGLWSWSALQRKPPVRGASRHKPPAGQGD